MRIARCASLIHELTAKATGQTVKPYSQLCVGHRRRIHKKLAAVISLVAAGNVSCAADLHAYHCQQLTADGWRYGKSWRPVRGESDLLTDFNKLSAHVQALIQQIFQVLSETTAPNTSLLTGSLRQAILSHKT
jgi:hypothetical protein